MVHREGPEASPPFIDIANKPLNTVPRLCAIGCNELLILDISHLLLPSLINAIQSVVSKAVALERLSLPIHNDCEINNLSIKVRVL